MPGEDQGGRRPSVGKRVGWEKALCWEGTRVGEGLMLIPPWKPVPRCLSKTDGWAGEGNHTRLGES
jgi:hypothetical protein